jgi:hypothetical protein
MSLPKQLLYDNKINASYARNYNSVLQPQNTSNYGLGQTCIINIPAMNNTAMSGADTVLSMTLNLETTAAASTVHLNRCGGAGVIQRLRLFAGSQLLCDIDNYGQLASLLTTYQQSRDDVRGKSQVLQGTAELRGATIADNLGDDVAFSRQLAFPLMSILSMTDNYVPLWALSSIGTLRLELQFVSSVQKFCGATSIPTFQAGLGANSIFSDVKLVANMVEMSDQAMGIIQSSLGGKPVEWVCQSYSNYVYNATLGAGVTNISMPIAAKYNSLKALYICMRGSPDGLANRYADDSPTFTLAEYSTRIGAKVIPSEKPTTVPQFLAEAERALGCVSNRHSPHSYTYEQITSAVDNATAAAGGPGALVRSSAFMVGVETESYSNTDIGGRVYQGLNTSTDDIFFQAQFTAGNDEVRFDAYACFDQLIVIDNGAVAVQF